MNNRGFQYRSVVLIALLVCGCAQYKPRAIDPAASALQFEQRTLVSTDLKRFMEANLHRSLDQWPMAAWDFDSLTLAAFYYHPDLDTARAKLGEARAAMVTAGQRPNPSLSVVPGFDTTTYHPSPWILGADLDIPIETAHKRGYRLAQTKFAAQSARLGIAATAWQVRSRLHQAMLQLYAAERTAEVLRQQESARREIVSFIEKQKGLGMVSAVDIAQARIGLTNVRLEVLETERSAAEARAAVAEAVGVPAEAIQPLTLKFAPSEQLAGDGSSSELRRVALQNRADVLVALADYSTAQAALQLEVAKQYPDIHLGPGYQYDQGDNKWSVGVSIELPLNGNRGAIAEAEARRTSAVTNLTSVQAKAAAEIDRALASYKAAKTKAEAAKKMLADLQSQRESSQKLFEAGELSRLDLLTLNLELQSNEQAELDARLKTYQAAGALEDAVQKPLSGAEAALLERGRTPATQEATSR